MGSREGSGVGGREGSGEGSREGSGEGSREVVVSMLVTMPPSWLQSTAADTHSIFIISRAEYLMWVRQL